MCLRACWRNSSSATTNSTRLLEPAGRKVGEPHLVLVGEAVEQLADGLIEHGMLQLGGEIGERAENEGALVHQEMGDVQVIVSAGPAVVAEENVDVQRARLAALVRRSPPAAGAPKGPFHFLHLLEEVRGIEGGLDGHHAVEEPRLPALRALAWLPLPRLRPVHAGGV